MYDVVIPDHVLLLLPPESPTRGRPRKRALGDSGGPVVPVVPSGASGTAGAAPSVVAPPVVAHHSDREAPVSRTFGWEEEEEEHVVRDHYIVHVVLVNLLNLNEFVG